MTLQVAQNLFEGGASLMAPVAQPTRPKVEFVRGKYLDAKIVKKLLEEQRDDIVKKQRFTQDKHQMIRFQAGRGMSRASMEKTWGCELVAEALDSEGIQTSIAAE